MIADKSISVAPLGILMLDTGFSRIPGDIGNAEAWPFPVLFRTVQGASADKVVLDRAKGLLPDFIEAARELIGLGALGITTSCGFLLQVPWIETILPPSKRVGIITISRSTLTAAHLEAAGIASDTPVGGLECDSEFFKVMVKGEEIPLDADRACKETIAATRKLVERHPDIGAIVLECTNMPPYSAAIGMATGLPVFDIYSMITWFHAGLRPRQFGG